jgi:error-prone DNA polymerase
VSDPFVHLHVASGYSLRHGASTPAALVDAAAEHGMDALALTDRDGAYGAIKFAVAARAAGIRPILGVDLAVADDAAGPSRRGTASGPGQPARRTPARGGAIVDRRLPRVTVLGRGRSGWAAVCRLISTVALRGRRGDPVADLATIAERCGDSGTDLTVLLGPGSDVGRALSARRPDLAERALRRWREIGGEVMVEVVCHRGPDDLVRAARLFGFAGDQQVSAVLSNAVRCAERRDGPTLDVLDAARRLVPLDARNVDRVNGEAYLKSGKQMADIADEVARAAGAGDRAGPDLLTATRRLADRCVLDPVEDLGIGSLHLPEFTRPGTAPAGSAGSVRAVAERPEAIVLRQRCEAGFGRRGLPDDRRARTRLDEELGVIGQLGYPSYFLAVADVVELIKQRGVRCAARGSGAGSLVTYLLGISDVDPLRHRLLMERFLSPLREELPDIDLDVESARRTEVYEQILAAYGADRCTCVSMMDTYRARHAIRDVGAALGLPPGEIDALAKAFPHIRANQVRAALRDLPELRASGLARRDGGAWLDLVLRLVERLDGLPRHIALHPCGVVLSDATLLDRTPVEASWLGFPMSQFDKDDVQTLGLLKLDVLGIRMQSAIAHAVGEIRRVDGVAVDIDTVPRDDSATFDLIRSTRTLGCFQIESPGQRELIGKFAPESFDDIIIDISLFRPGPVKSDMIRPFLEVRHGWGEPSYLHEDLRQPLEQTCGVVVFHEQVLEIFHVITGCSLADADEARRALGDPAGQPEVRAWFVPTALRRGYDLATVERVWEVLKSFGSFGFCKAHAAAFAVPTYQSAWLKAHHPAAFLAGVLTHDPGMYPKRLILDDARQFGISILPLDVNVSTADYRVERLAQYDEPPPAILGQDPEPSPALPAHRYGIRLSLADVKGITETEITRIVAGRPYGSLSDFWTRSAVSRPIAERLVMAGGFDAIYGIGSAGPIRRRGQITRRDLLLQVVELDAYTRSRARSAGGRRGTRVRSLPSAATGEPIAIHEQAAAQSQAAAPVPPPEVQLAFDLGDEPEAVASGLPELTAVEQVRAELDVLGLDASRHVLTGYEPFFTAVGVTRARDLLHCRSRAEILVAGVKVATQTPPIRSGRRVVFVTLDDATGPLDATFFEDAQVGHASTLFHSWLLVIRGVVRRTGPRGVSLRATGCWELTALHRLFEAEGITAVHREIDGLGEVGRVGVSDAAVHGAAASRSTRPVLAAPPVGGRPTRHASGFLQSPYSDVGPPGSGGQPTRKLWHSSPGSSGG